MVINSWFIKDFQTISFDVSVPKSPPTGKLLENKFDAIFIFIYLILFFHRTFTTSKLILDDFVKGVGMRGAQ